MTDAEKTTRPITRRVIKSSFFFRGGFRITAGSAGSTPSDWLGGPMRQAVRRVLSELSEG